MARRQSANAEAANGTDLSFWRDRALAFEAALRGAIIGQDRVIEFLTISVFARGHVLLEGDVGGDFILFGEHGMEK